MIIRERECRGRRSRVRPVAGSESSSWNIVSERVYLPRECVVRDADLSSLRFRSFHVTGKTLRKWRVPWRWYCGLLPWRSSSRRRWPTRSASSATVSDPTSKMRDSRPAIFQRRRFRVSKCEISCLSYVSRLPIILVSCALREIRFGMSFRFSFVCSRLLAPY